MTENEKKLLLGVNIDHVATLRQARGTTYPDVLAAADEAIAGGADSITVHLREDRRHIQDDDVRALCDRNTIRVNLEMAVTQEMLEIACTMMPSECCLVPEKREELTTEGGLDVAGQTKVVSRLIGQLQEAGIKPAVFIDPEPAQLQATWDAGCRIVELHTGSYADARSDTERNRELQRIEQAADRAVELGLTVHAGHGLTVANVGAVASIAHVKELNIGHSIVARAVFVGLRNAVAEMKAAIHEARKS